jgi:hypothetical protein
MTTACEWGRHYHPERNHPARCGTPHTPHRTPSQQAKLRLSYFLRGQRGTSSPRSSLAIVSRSGHVWPANTCRSVTCARPEASATDLMLREPTASRRFSVNLRATSPMGSGEATSGQGAGASAAGLARTGLPMRIRVDAHELEQEFPRRPYHNWS